MTIRQNSSPSSVLGGSAPGSSIGSGAYESPAADSHSSISKRGQSAGESKFTPGPWRWHYPEMGGSRWGNEGPFLVGPAWTPVNDDEPILKPWGYDAAGLEIKSDADAALIAAAPELLAAIRDLLVIAEQNITDLAADAQEGAPVAKMEMTRWSAVLSAYAKATGEAR